MRLQPHPHLDTHTDPPCSPHNAANRLLRWSGPAKPMVPEKGPKMRKRGVAVLGQAHVRPQMDGGRHSPESLCHPQQYFTTARARTRGGRGTSRWVCLCTRSCASLYTCPCPLPYACFEVELLPPKHPKYTPPAHTHTLTKRANMHGTKGTDRWNWHSHTHTHTHTHTTVHDPPAPVYLLLQPLAAAG